MVVLPHHAFAAKLSEANRALYAAAEQLLQTKYPTLRNVMSAAVKNGRDSEGVVKGSAYATNRTAVLLVDGTPVAAVVLVQLSTPGAADASLLVRLPCCPR